MAAETVDGGNGKVPAGFVKVRRAQMGLGFALVLAAFGISLMYKGYKGYSWPDFYKTVFGK